MKRLAALAPPARALLLALPLALSALACGSSQNKCYDKFSEEPKLSEIQSHVFNRSCAFTSCHGDTDTHPVPGPMNLSQGKAWASLSATATERPASKRAEPMNENGSYIVEKLTSDMPTDGVRMPKDTDPLCDGEIGAIRAWIRLGAKNN